MNKIIKNVSLCLLLMSVSCNSIAAFVLNGTRFIYGEGNKNISFEVTNNSERSYGGQIWLENETENDDRVIMIPTPSFFRIGPKQKQIMRIIKAEGELPADRESLFWLNVQEIPPKPDSEDGNVLSVAINTRVKVFYRPKHLMSERKGAEKKIRIERIGGEVQVINPTPYYFSLVSINMGKVPLSLSDKEIIALGNIPPFDKVSLGKRTLTGSLTINAINDWGGVETIEVRASHE